MQPQGTYKTCVLHCTVFYCTVWYGMVWCGVVRYGIVLSTLGARAVSRAVHLGESPLRELRLYVMKKVRGEKPWYPR